MEYSIGIPSSKVGQNINHKLPSHFNVTIWWLMQNRNKIFRVQGCVSIMTNRIEIRFRATKYP